MIATNREEKKKLLEDKYDIFPNDYSTFDMNAENAVARTQSFDPANRVTVSWHNINVRVKPKKKFFRFSSQKEESEQKQLLFNVNGEVRPGTLLAIMGASGAGKTTLLNVLTRRNLRLLNVEGDVQVNGQLVGDSMTRISAYVQQDDLFIGTLTVKEHLVFQALLRMDKHLSYQERMKRVEEVISEMGLRKCENTIIGVSGRIKGISGGEAKRLAFAAEVLTNPALMFCDEPTSGLDSFMSQSIVSVLRNMAQGGRTIICTIHQPSSEVYALFDNLLLMAEGRVAYLGKAAKAINFFEKAGLQCPINYNPADFFVQSLAIVQGKEAESRERVKKIYELFKKEGQNFENSSSLGSSSFVDVQTNSKSRYKASWWRQFSAVLWRSWVSLIREPMLTKARFMQSLVIGLLFGLVYFNQKLDEKGVMNINGAIFLCLMNTTFSNMFAVVNAFTLEQPIFLREHGNGMYRTDVYFIAKTLTEAPILIAMTTIFTIIVYFMIGLNLTVSAFFIALAILILIANTAASFGYMVSCISSSLNVALSIATPLIMPLVLFGGFYLNADSVPVYFIWIKYISWFLYGNEALSINQWKDVTNITCSTKTCPPSGDVVLQTLNFHEENMVLDICLIVVLMVVYRVLAFVALLYKSSKKT